MRNVFAIVFFFLSGVAACFAGDNNHTDWQKGVVCYNQKQYDSAAWYFEHIASLQPGDAEIYYNLGNVYYRQNKIALAVLNYERALKYSPDYVAAKDNLALTRGRISNAILPVRDIFFVNWWQGITRRDKATSWAITALVLFVLAIVAMLLRRLKKTAVMPVQVTGFLFFAMGCFLILSIFATRNYDSHAAVVMQADAPLMNADLKGKPMALVPEGTTVKLKGDNGMWAEVVLPDGREGWLQVILLEKI